MSLPHAPPALAAMFRSSKGPPKGYVPGLGRGATGFSTRGDLGTATEDAGTGSRSAAARAARSGRDSETVAVGAYDPFEGYAERPVSGQFDNDEDDDAADQVWAAIDERLKHKRKRRRDDSAAENGGQATARSRISAQFRDAKEALATEMTEDMWAAIPDVQGDASLKFKKQHRKQPDIITPISDSLLEQRHGLNTDATAGNARLAATMTASIDGTDGTQTSLRTNMSGLSAARGTVLGMSLDKASGLATSTAVDATGYLTSLAATEPVGAGVSANSVQDIHKARLLLKSVRDTNPKHGPGWIASARVEEAAGKILQARKIMQEACQVCPDNEDVWLEAARLHPQGNVAKSILATAVRRIPTSIKLFLKAAELETSEAAKKAVLRKGLETNPTSVTLWKAAIELEDADNARILLSVAVDKVPHAVDFWLALARLETYENAQRILNKARKALTTERSIWIAAAKLEESQAHNQIVEKIIERAVRSLEKNEAVITRAQWLQEAEAAEAAQAPITSAAIVKYTIGKDVDEEDRQRTWAEDAKSSVARGSVITARAILAHALSVFPTKRGLWMQAVELERKHGTPVTLDEVLAAASERQPQVEIFWLLRAKEQWQAGNVDKAREILTEAFKANPESEAVWLAAAKLEWETGELERARVLLQRARERAPTDRVYMKSALFERQHQNFEVALQLIEEGLRRYPLFAKLYCMGGQICSDDLPKTKKSLDRARNFYQRGIEKCPSFTVLWILASRLEERAAVFDPDGKDKPDVGPTKARSLLELARLKNLKSPELWLEAIRLERRTGNIKNADSVMARALQDCPQSGLLLAENIYNASRVEQKSKSSDAVKRCPEDPLVIAAVASLFASERKTDKARKWFDRAVILNPDLGDSWARYYAFELVCGLKEDQEKVKERCIAAEPKHGEIWTSVSKAMVNLSKSTGEVLELAAKAVPAFNGSH